MNVELAVKGLAVLTAIPVVLFALWADYFTRRLARLAKEDPKFDRAAELYKVRLAGVFAIFFQFGIFMGTSGIREDASILCNLLFVGAIVLQSIIQTSLERKARVNSEASPAKNPVQDMEVAARAFFWALIGGVLYIGALIVPVVLVTWVAHWSGASALASSTAVIGAAIVGMISGLGINFALGAYYLRKMLPTSAVQDESLRGLLKNCFVGAGLPTPDFWLVETGRLPEATAVMAGFQSGRGIFKPGLFISRGMIDSLNDAELRAVIMHEVSHLKLQHLRRRLLFSVVLIFGTTSAATFSVFVANLLSPDTQSRGFIGVVAAATAFALTFKLLGRQNRAHEVEADFHAIENLDAGVDNLASALRKLDRINHQDPLRKNPMSTLTGQGHPATERRIAILRARFNAPAENTVEKHHDRAA